jgi:anti-anti-sigma factor
MIELDFDSINSTLSCKFSGRMDSHVSPDIEKSIATKLEEISKETSRGPLRILFDLSEVSYIASAFIRICLATAKNISRENFAVKNTSPFVMKIFKVAGLDKELNVS